MKAHSLDPVMDDITPAEDERVLGDMVKRAETLGVDMPRLRLSRCHAGTHVARRKQETAAI